MTSHDIERLCAEYLVAIGHQDWATLDRIGDLAEADLNLQTAIMKACVETYKQFVDFMGRWAFELDCMNGGQSK